MIQYRFSPLVISCLLLSNSIFADQCTNLQNQAHNAFNAGDLDNAKQAYSAIQSTSCLGREKTYVSKQIAYLMYDKLRKRNPTGGHLIAGFNDILNYYPEFWPALVDLAEIYERRRDFATSAQFYEKAVDAINDPDKTSDGDAPNPQKLTEIYQMAESMRLASPVYVSSNTRGFGVKYRNVPIHFDFGRKTLAGHDLKAAKGLLKRLRRSGSPYVTLIGHTDPVGNRKPNQRLSVARATTVKKYLVKMGYNPGKISISGKGEDRPLRDPHAKPKNHYGKKVWHRMLRRVQIVIH